MGAPNSSEGARSAAHGESSAATEMKRRLAGQKKAVVRRRLRGESVDAVSRELAALICRLDEWRDEVLIGNDAGFQARENDPMEHQRNEVNRRLDEWVKDVEILQKERWSPLADRKSSRAAKPLCVLRPRVAPDAQNGALFPHSWLQRKHVRHEGRIRTERPNER